MASSSEARSDGASRLARLTRASVAGTGGSEITFTLAREGEVPGATHASLETVGIGCASAGTTSAAAEIVRGSRRLALDEAAWVVPAALSISKLVIRQIAEMRCLKRLMLVLRTTFTRSQFSIGRVEGDLHPNGLDDSYPVGELCGRVPSVTLLVSV